MDFLGQSINQVRELFRTMTPAARITSALLLGVIVVSLGYLIQNRSSGPGDFLFNGESLESREADLVLAAIAKGGLTDAVRDGNRIRVPRGQELAYMGAILDAGALPVNYDTLLDKSLDSSMFASSNVQKQQINAYRERRIAMMLREMAGVADAKVMYSASQERGRGFAKQRETATVSILPDPSAEFSSRQIKMIRSAVANANSMAPSDVTVLDLSSGAELTASGGDAAADFDDPYYNVRVQYENYMEEAIRGLLGYIPGVRIEVSATLDKQLTSQTHSVASQGEGTPIREVRETESSENTRTENSGRPGLTAQSPTRTATNENVATTRSVTTAETNDIESLVPRSDTIVTEAGLVPERVMAAIMVPRDYVVSVWRERQRMNDPNADPAAQPSETNLSALQTDIDNDISEAVIRLLPIRSGDNKWKDVAVTFVDSLRPEPIEPPSTASKALQWASQNFSTVIMAGVALMSLAMLRSLVKSIPPSEPVATLAGPALSLSGTYESDATSSSSAAGTSGQKEGGGDEQRKKLKLNKGPSLKDDLTDIVREDPDAAAAILRSWIGNAA